MGAYGRMHELFYQLELLFLPHKHFKKEEKGWKRLWKVETVVCICCLQKSLEEPSILVWCENALKDVWECLRAKLTAEDTIMYELYSSSVLKPQVSGQKEKNLYLNISFIYL